MELSEECKYKTAIERIGINNYIYVHVWLKKNHGKASKCEICHNPGKNYNWALKKGCEYEKRLENFIQLCVSCHRKYDYNEEVVRRITQKISNKPRPNRYVSVIRIGLEGDKKEYESIMRAAHENNMLRSAIANCLSKRSKIAGGYKWVYK
jgi:hypothetical protein